MIYRWYELCVTKESHAVNYRAFLRVGVGYSRVELAKSINYLKLYK